MKKPVVVNAFELHRTGNLVTVQVGGATVTVDAADVLATPEAPLRTFTRFNWDGSPRVDA